MSKIVLGVTGKVGVGKTFLVNALEGVISNLNSIDLDKVGHYFLEKNEIKQQIIDQFGTSVITKENTIHRPTLGKIVFNNSELLRVLNGIIHPAIKQGVIDQIKQTSDQTIVIVGALINEIGLLNYCDHVIFITTKSEKRKQLLGKKGIIDQHQASEDIYKHYADSVFENVFEKVSVDKFQKLVQNLIKET